MSKQAGTVVMIQRKNAFDWEGLKTKIESEHWRKLLVTIQIREKMHAGKPAQLDAANAMLNARGLGEVVEAREAERPVEERADEVVDEGLCEFHRREGKPGLWWPSNNLKACFKENWSVLGYRKDATPRADRENKKKTLQGSRGAWAEGVFVGSSDPADRDWIYLADKPSGIDQSVSHIIGPSGPRAAIKRNEYLVRPCIKAEVWIARAIEEKIPDESFADMLIHAQEHGIGANRSQGFGRFDVVSVTEL